jgi:nucleoside-diphosphate-sugar epimerase
MHVVLTGGTGYIGSAVLRRLREQGHEVTAVVRSHASAAAVREAGANPALGDLSDAGWLAALLADADGAIHTADLGGAGDDSVLDAVEAAFGGTTRPYVHTGGIWSWGSGDDITEESPLAPPALTSWREAREARVLASDVAAAVISPAVVYGHGRGIPVGVLAGNRDGDGVVTLVGSGEQHWTSVHVDDLAELYVLALEKGATGAFIGASGVNPTVRELGEALGEVRPESAEASRERLGAGFADALLLDQQASGAKARTVLGWAPSRPSVVDDLRELVSARA